MAVDKGPGYVEERYEQELHRGLGVLGNIAITLSAVTPASSVFIIVPAIFALAGTGSFLAMVFAALVVAFSFTRSIAAMSIITLFAGAAYISTNSLIMTSIQAAVPGYLRGRVMALFMMAFMGVMPLSAFAFGPLGQAIGPDTAVLAGGIALLVWALTLTARPHWLAAATDVSLAGPPRG